MIHGRMEMDTLDETSISGTGGVSMAPTAQLTHKRKSHELEMCKLRVEWQKEKIDDLTKERDYLKEEMASALNSAGTSSIQVTPMSSNPSSDRSDKSFAETMSASSSKASSSDEYGKKKTMKIEEGPCQHVGVDRNTVVDNAPIAELFFA
ncbi:homeotic protein female sterile-like [Tachysurus ichikawai]